MITCTITSFNEEHRIDLVLKCAQLWADEVILIDKGSTDRTIEIALKLGVSIHTIPFSPQGTEKVDEIVACASNDWILGLTAGEIPTPELIVNLKRLIRENDEQIDLILIPFKYWSFGSHDALSPWSWSMQPRCFNRTRITYINEVHRHLTAASNRTINLSHLSQRCHVLHQTHPNAETFMRSHWDYMRAESAADPLARLNNALKQLADYEKNHHGNASLMQMHAWKLYWHGVALHCLEKLQDRDILKEYSWRRLLYYQLWDQSSESQNQNSLDPSSAFTSRFGGSSDSRPAEWVLGNPSNSVNSHPSSTAHVTNDVVTSDVNMFLFNDPLHIETLMKLKTFFMHNEFNKEAEIVAEKLWSQNPLDLAKINNLIIQYYYSSNARKALAFADKILNTFGDIETISHNRKAIHLRENRSSDEGDLPPPVPTKLEPKISAIVSVYNASRFLEKCIVNLLNQSIYLKGDLEIVVVNTGSQENERDIIESFTQKGYCIKYIEVPQRETVYSAWNRAIKIASGEYITSANSDDRHHSAALHIMSEELDKRPDVSLVYADVNITEEENQTFDTALVVGQYKWLDYSPANLLKGCFCGPQPMWRKKVHEEVGFFDPEFVSAGDYEMWLRLGSRFNFFHIKQTLGLYLKSPTSVEHSNRERASSEVQIALDRHKSKILSLMKNKLIDTN